MWFEAGLHGLNKKIRSATTGLLDDDIADT